jgi:hypothetical protein
VAQESLQDWCDAIASLCVDALQQAKLTDAADAQKAMEIVAEELLVRISMGDLPPTSAQP